MKVIQQLVSLEHALPETEVLNLIQAAGRTSYKSENGDAKEFVRMLIKRGHLSVLEHCSMSFRFITDRGVTHELVRHRIASFTQESTRYCNYSATRFGSNVTFVVPIEFLSEGKYHHLYLLWEEAMRNAEGTYFAMLAEGLSPQLARSVLPNSLKTEIVVTANLREWMHIFELRTSEAAHPQMKNLMAKAQYIAEHLYPTIFGRNE